MNRTLDVREFFALLNKGVLDGRLSQELKRLSREELEELAKLMAEQISRKRD